MASSRCCKAIWSASGGNCRIQWYPPVAHRCGDHRQRGTLAGLSPHAALSLSPNLSAGVALTRLLTSSLFSLGVWQQPVGPCTASNCVRWKMEEGDTYFNVWTFVHLDCSMSQCNNVRI